MKKYKQHKERVHEFEIEIQGHERLKMFEDRGRYLVNHINDREWSELGIIRKSRPNNELEFVPFDLPVSGYSVKLVNAILEALEWARDFLHGKTEFTRKDHLNTLVNHQLWRTGVVDEPASPQDLTAALDFAIEKVNKEEFGLRLNKREDLIEEYEHLTGDDAYTPSGKPKRAYRFWLEEKMLIVLAND